MNAFKGFQSPTTTETPNEFYDIALANIDNLPELKVVGYVLRRTLGFDKRMDWISLSQFEKGVVTKEGQSLDAGVGLTRPSIVAGLKRAVEHGWLIKVIRCPGCSAELQPTRRPDRQPHASEYMIPSHCPRCKGVVKGREQVYYGLHWQNPPMQIARRRGVVNVINYPHAGSSKRGLLPPVNAVNPHMKYEEEEAAFIFLSRTFADAVAVPTYEMSKKEQRKVRALLQEGFTPETIAAVIVRVVNSKNDSTDPVHTIAYCLPTVRLEKMDRHSQLSESAAERGIEPSTEAPAESGEPPHLFVEHAEGDTVLLTLLQRVQRMNAKPLNEEHVRLWRALCSEPWVIELAQKFKIASGALLVLEAVDAAIASGSVREDFLAPSMADKFLRGWQEHGRNGHRQKPRSPRSSASAASRPTSLQFDSPEAFEKSLEKPGSQV